MRIMIKHIISQIFRQERLFLICIILVNIIFDQTYRNCLYFPRNGFIDTKLSFVAVQIKAPFIYQLNKGVRLDD